jgi:hypothetical protein
LSEFQSLMQEAVLSLRVLLVFFEVGFFPFECLSNWLMLFGCCNWDFAYCTYQIRVYIGHGHLFKCVCCKRVYSWILIYSWLDSNAVTVKYAWCSCLVNILTKLQSFLLLLFMVCKNWKWKLHFSKCVSCSYEDVHMIFSFHLLA